MSATKQDYSCLCEGRLPKLSSLDLEWAAPLFRCPSAHLHSYCPRSNDYLAVLRDKRNKTQRKNSSCLVDTMFSFLSNSRTNLKPLSSVFVAEVLV